MTRDILGRYSSICPIVFNVFERLKDELRDEQDDVWGEEPGWSDFAEPEDPWDSE